MCKEKLILAYDTINKNSIALPLNKLNGDKNTFDLLSMESIDSSIQIVVVQGIELYKEYHPITYINNGLDFIINTLQLIRDTKHN